MPTPPSPSRPVLIAGAGIGGLTAALGLTRRGVPVEVYERRRTGDIFMAGSGLTIWSNATTALGALGLEDALLARGEPVRGGTSVNEHEHVIYRMRTARYTWPGSVPSVSISRGDLIELLVEACQEAGVTIHEGQRCVGYDQDADGVVLKLEDGSTVQGSVLIGADGIRSAILAQLHGGLPDPLYTGRSTYRGISPTPEGLDPGTVYMFHHAGTRVGGGAWHVGRGRVAWTLSCAADPSEREDPSVLKERATELARPLPGLPSRLVAATDADAVIRTDIFYHDWRERWGDGRVTLLGDAAHAMPTDLGQGACQAIEDAVVLADSLAGRDDPVAALRTYEQRRIPRVRWVREQVMRLVKWPQINNRVVKWLVTKVIAPVVIAVKQRTLWRELQRPPVPWTTRPAVRETR
ncbi:FAD-dependent monooxygenase [Streptomyces sp. NPDC005925]|uniref:FAD-dependent monooxygenase n=1 Tax=Streptomyces sp. NPDC005925 TaxID=3157172 RepID=UPI0033F45AB5